jgi:hypothetical protein
VEEGVAVAAAPRATDLLHMQTAAAASENGVETGVAAAAAPRAPDQALVKL